MKRAFLLLSWGLLFGALGCTWQRPVNQPYGTYAPTYAPGYAVPQQACVPQQPVYAAPPPCVCN